MSAREREPAIGWMRTRIIVSSANISVPKILRDSGIPDSTNVIAIVRDNVIHTEFKSEWVWQGCVSDATLISVEMVESRDLPVPSSPLEVSTGALLLSNDLSLYISETTSTQYGFKNREVLWIQPMVSHPVQEVWFSPSYECAEEQLIQQFLDQIYKQASKHRIIVKMNNTLLFTLNNSSHDPSSSSGDDDELWFNVLHVSPIAQGHLTEQTKIIIVPPMGNKPNNSGSDSSSDEGLTYLTQETTVMRCSDSDDTENEDNNLGSHDQPSSQSRQPLMSASEIEPRKLSLPNPYPYDNIHLLECIPLINFPLAKNFILISAKVRERLGCYGLENLLISPVECPGHHGNQDIKYVAIIEDAKAKIGGRVSSSAIYVHPEVYFNLFPFPVDHVSTHHIRAEIYRPGLTDNDEPCEFLW